MNLNNEKIWIAGHSGMVGQALVRKLETSDVLTVSRSKLDLTNREAVFDWMSENQPSLVFLAAAKVGGIKANSENPVDFLLDNLKIQNNVIEAGAYMGIKKLIFMGSACSYPKQAVQPIKENSFMNGAPERTNIWYATAKIAGVKLAQAYATENKLNSVIAMPTNTYGPYDNFNEHSNHVIPALMKRFENAKQNNCAHLEIWGSGKPLREFLYVDDLADALVFLAETYDSTEIINIGSGDETSILELANVISEITGFEGSIITDPTQPDGMMRKLLDSSKLQQLGWSSTTSLFNGLNEMYHWALKNHKL